MRALKTILIFCACVVLLVLLGVGTYIGLKKESSNRQQVQLEPFYATPDPLPTKPGTLIRSEPLTGTVVPGAKAYRMMYVTEGPTGQPRVSSGMVFIPDAPAPPEGRKIMSWAHPTVGMGDACAPSRTANPTGILQWLPGMIARGWIVTATDYAGLGTDGVEDYLIAKSEVHDVVNAVRAARAFPDSQAGTDYGVFGHSQGGHSSMWAGTLGPKYAPELNLVGVAGAAPAAPLSALVDREWDQNSTWVIGPEVFVSFPNVYPDLSIEEVGTSTALSTYESMANSCLLEGLLEGEIRTDVGEKFFASNPLDNPAWKAAITEQDAPPTKPDMPALVIESVNDGVVIPRSIADMQQQWCDAGSDLQVAWLGPLRGNATSLNVMSHMYEGVVGGAIATTWFERLFAGLPPGPATCKQTPPLVPGSP